MSPCSSAIWVKAPDELKVNVVGAPSVRTKVHVPPEFWFKVAATLGASEQKFVEAVHQAGEVPDTYGVNMSCAPSSSVTVAVGPVADNVMPRL